MDYGSLLQLAKKNADQKTEVKSRVLPALPPARSAEDARKQELEKKKLLDANVAKFLAKRKDEEARRKKEANEKRGELLALRNKDSKARRRVKVMNSSAKSADKSAIEDAVGPSDYYVIEEPLCFMSKECLAQEEKFLTKLCSGPLEEKFSKGKANNNKDLMGTKNRVKLALQLGDTFGKEKYKVEKDSSSSSTKTTHKKEDKKEDRRVANSGSDDSGKTERREKPKKNRQPRPPPMNYHDLLLLAEKLHKEPVQEVQEKAEEGLRPMTTKEREIYLIEEASRKRKEAGWREEERLKKLGKLPTYKMPVPTQSRIPKVSTADKPNISIPRIPKLNGYSQDRKTLGQNNTPSSSTSNSKSSERPSNSKPSSDRAKTASKTNSGPAISSPASESTKSKSRPTSSSSKQTSLSKHTAQTSKSLSVKLPSKPPADLKLKNIEKKPAHSVPNQATAASVRPRQCPPPDVKLKALPPSKPSLVDVKPSQSSSGMKSRQLPPADIKSKQPSTNVKPRQFPPPNVKSRQFPPPDVKSRQFPPPDVQSRQSSSAESRPKQFPPSDMRRKPKPVQKRRIIESDDEYDSDVADFIDDGPAGNDEDYSKHIREIFGYDPSRYKGIDEDDRGMESSFQQQLKEEFTSTKLGILEDLEDIKKEKLAMMRKKKKQRVK